MCINVLRSRPRPFKFGWFWNTFCDANISVFLPRLFVTWPHVGHVLHGGILSLKSPERNFFYQNLSSMTRVMIHWDSIHNKWYLLIQMKISQMEKSVLMILNVKYIYWHFLLAKVTLEMGKGFLWQLSYFFFFFNFHGSWLKYRSIPQQKMY